MPVIRAFVSYSSLPPLARPLGGQPALQRRNPQRMHQIIYISQARTPLTSAELSMLLLKSRVNNDVLDVTGMLIYRDGSIMQLLEGEADNMIPLFSTISEDPRHHAIQVLHRADVDARVFPGWSMGFVHYDNKVMEEPTELAEFFDKKGMPGPNSGTLALKVLSQFRYGSLRRRVERGFAPVVIR